jgi:small subunit ribosomal protein S20
MPNTPGAKKRLRQSETRRLANRSKRTNLRGQIRKVRDAVAAGDHEKAQAELRIAQKKLDKAAASHLIHRNAAARTKSRLVQLVKKVG